MDEPVWPTNANRCQGRHSALFFPFYQPLSFAVPAKPNFYFSDRTQAQLTGSTQRVIKMINFSHA